MRFRPVTKIVLEFILLVTRRTVDPIRCLGIEKFRQFMSYLPSLVGLEQLATLSQRGKMIVAVVISAGALSVCRSFGQTLDFTFPDTVPAHSPLANEPAVRRSPNTARLTTTLSADAHHSPARVANDVAKSNGHINDWWSTVRNWPSIASLVRAKRYEDALDECNRMLELAPNLAWAYSNRGVVLTYLKRYEEALHDHDKALSLEPRTVTYVVNRAYTLIEMGQYTSAIADLTKAIEQTPTDPDAFLNRGRARARRGDREGAIADLQRASALYLVQKNGEGHALAARELDALSEALLKDDGKHSR